MQQPNLQNLNRRASVSVTSGGIAVPLANGNIMMIPVAEEQGKYNEDSYSLMKKIIIQKPYIENPVTDRQISFDNKVGGLLGIGAS